MAKFHHKANDSEYSSVSFGDRILFYTGWMRVKEIKKVPLGAKIVSGTTINNFLERLRTIY